MSRLPWGFVGITVYAAATAYLPMIGTMWWMGILGFPPWWVTASLLVVVWVASFAGLINSIVDLNNHVKDKR